MIQLKEFEARHVEYGDYELQVSRYATGGMALLIQGDYGRVATVTVNLDTPPSEGCVWVKTWSENEGILEALVARGLLEETGRTMPTGYVSAHEARLIGPLA